MKSTLIVAGLLLALPVQAQTTYRIDPAHSTLTYAMNHRAHDWSGTSRAVAGTVVVDGAGQVVGGAVETDVMSFDSGNRSRDSHMGEVVEFYLFPTVRFEVEQVRPLPPGEAPNEGANALVAGRLTFHGVTRPLEVPAAVAVTETGVHVAGRFEVTLTEFDLERPSFMMVKVKDWIGLTFDLSATPAQDASH